jgi:hypothetical protein
MLRGWLRGEGISGALSHFRVWGAGGCSHFGVWGHWQVQPYRSIVGSARCSHLGVWGALVGTAIPEYENWGVTPFRSMGALEGAAISENAGRWRVQPFRSMGGSGGHRHFGKWALACAAISEYGGAGGCSNFGVWGALAGPAISEYESIKEVQ